MPLKKTANRRPVVDFPIGICRQTQSGGFRCRPSASASDWLAGESVRIRGQSLRTFLAFLPTLSLANCYQQQPRHLLDYSLRCVRCPLTLLNQLTRNESFTHRAEKTIIPNPQNVCLARNCADAILICSLFLMPRRVAKKNPLVPPVTLCEVSRLEPLYLGFFMAWRIPRLPALSDLSFEVTPGPCRHQNTWNCPFIPSFSRFFFSSL